MVHGSGFTTRSDTALLTDYFVSRGYAVLAYDKRGTGQSGGSWPGELATPLSIGTYAKDAEAAARFLAAQPGIDRARVGLAGASQAGWIMPLAAARELAIRFLVLWAAPTVTTGEQRTYQDLTGEGVSTPSLSHAEIIAAVRKDGPSGFDPMPSIRKLRIPTLWLYGDIDQHVPTDLCVEKLSHVGGDVTVHVFPSADHFLLVTAHALQAEELRTSHFADGTFTTIDAWLASHHLG
jgi:pimeloyl-ACP methyl ester carboxylesterase